MPVPMVSKILQNNRWGFRNRLIEKILRIKSNVIIGRIGSHIKGGKILDVGTGVGGIHFHLQQLGYEVVGLDVKNVSAYPDITPIIYDGRTFPFSDNQFDTGIIIHVLHHCDDGVKVLSEAMRTCNRIILIEDTYRNWFEHKIVSFNDNISNWEWYQHPYRKTDWWANLFKERDWKIIYQEEYSEFTYKFLYGRYVLFVLEK